MSEVETPRRSRWIIGLCGFAVLAFVAGIACMIWAKNAGTPITSDEPYVWDGQSNIVIAYHADYAPGEETCTVTPVDGGWGPSPFRLSEYHRDLGGIMGVRGETLLKQNYGSQALITCTKDGDRVLTGAPAVAADFWFFGPVLAFWALVAALVIYVRRQRRAVA